MLQELDVLEIRSIADLALAARAVRDRLLEKVADAALGEPVPARGEHNPGHAIELSDVLADRPEFVALREAIAALPRDIREKLWMVSRIGLGVFAILDWDAAASAVAVLADADIVADLLAEPDLSDLLHKGLYVLGAATPPEDVA